MKEEIKYIFSNVNDWLKFAEAKHAGLIVLNSVIIIGVLSSYSTNSQYFERTATLIALFCLGISIASSLISQFPQTSNILIRNKPNLTPNLYFFGDLSKISIDQFIDEFKKLNTTFSPDESDMNLINQILINSKITSVKYKIFKFCTWVSLFSIGLIGISAFIKAIWH